MAAFVPSAAIFWKNELYSDVRLTLRTAISAKPAGAAHVQGRADAPQSSGSARTQPLELRERHSEAGDDGTTAPAPASAQADALEHSSRTYHLHAVTLADASAHFRALMPMHAAAAAAAAATSADPGPRSTGSAGVTAPGGPAGHPSALLLVEHVEECELDAMEAVLRHCYTGQLCDDGDAAEDLSVTQLLDLMVLADRFDVPTCLAHSCEELARRSPTAHTLPTINRVLSDLTTGWPALPAFPAVVTAANERLLQLLGDAEAVCNEAGLHIPPPSENIDLLRLSLPSLLVLLSSEGLRARSDNSVLLLANLWVTGAGTVGGAAPPTAAQQRQVAAALRLGQLSPAFVIDVLPALPWLQLSGPEHTSLMRFAAAAAAAEGKPPTEQAVAKERLSDRQTHLVKTGTLHGPPAWFSAAPEAWVAAPGPPMEFGWVLTAAQLGVYLLAVQDTSNADPYVTSARRFFNGYVLNLALALCGEDGRPACRPGEQRVSASVCLVVTLAPCCSGGKRSLVESPLVCLAASCGVLQADPDGGWTASQPRTCFLQANSVKPCVLLDRLPRSSQLLDVAGWAPYLVDGRLHIRYSVSECS